MGDPTDLKSVKSSAIVIPDDFRPYPPGSFCLPSFYAKDVESVLIPEGLLRDRIKALAREIHAKYASTDEEPAPLVLVCVLKSSFKFFCALQLELELLNTEQSQLIAPPVSGAPYHNNGGQGNGTAIPSAGARLLPLLCEFIRVKSYVNTNSATENEVKIQGLADPVEAFAQKDVLIVEDIIDSGRTMQALLRNLQQYNMKSVRVVSMLWKRLIQGNSVSSFRPHFHGFEIPDRFVIGFGMDYNERYRDLNHLCIINAAGIARYATNQPS
ncbi:putative Hypoxanthine-guanine phosphoribosyltransferase [Hypsibius exemplaris]|uniref:Hypoxanthine-guanine phosphoribosyltransferase n=1 Tax=Hypsibius exemplaris TaxID=2072580 RepID=A0A1W0WBC3_HYPEX|nr:putative Hypoxanthine-guanine phosphoribosyltransferase [Hypsibius exemplaris]